MGLRINSNIPALQAGRQARRSNKLLDRTLRQLASGRRINQAADDAAGLAIAEQFSTQIRQRQAEINSLQSGINVTQTADAALGTQQEAIQRIRALSLQAANGTLSDENRATINTEVQQLVDQVNQVAENTQFNERDLLREDTTIELGVEGGAQIEIGGSTAEAIGLNNLDVTTVEGAQAAVQAADSAIAQVTENRANLGAQQNRLISAVGERETGILSAQEAESQIRDLDFARAAIERARNELLQQAGIAAIAQGNVTPQSALRLLGT